MAKEFLLIPKVKYESLLKQIKEKTQDDQTGGERQLDSISDLKSPETSKENTPKMEEDLPTSAKEGDKTKEDVKTVETKLFVEKPLSKMPFNGEIKRKNKSLNKGEAMKRQNRTGDDDSEDDFESQKDKKKIRSSNTDNEDCTSDNKNEKQNCFTCKVCNKRFTLLKNLCRHEISHRSVVKCEQCGGSFSRQDSLQRHKRTHHNENRRDNNKERREM
ncbi:PR domain zinc finger protein 15-like [Mercenaria mercenaria]|uniref:PR domain zinc finger protein 15-like n=1 Tax=Mercenaria mercenaria TaxID=6596 RepID=UPI00234F01FC|nr:PR domain zinc finger protein 15-like [Mercenaria mercenaria]